MGKSSVQPYLRRVEILAAQLGIEKDESRRKLAGEVLWDVEQIMGKKPPGCSDYEWKQREVAEFMRVVRDDMATLDEHGSSSGKRGKKLDLPTEIKIKNRIRRNIKLLKDKTSDPALRKAAKQESRQEELQALIRHSQATERMWANRNRRSTPGDADDDGAGAADAAGSGVIPLSAVAGPSGERTALLSDSPVPVQDAGRGELIDPADDPEFQVFYQEMRAHDKAIDAALDRISESLTRLHHNALGIKDELSQQNKLLDQVNQKAEDRTQELAALNRRLKQTLNEVEKDKFCCYLIFLLILLGLLGVVGSQVGIF